MHQRVIGSLTVSAVGLGCMNMSSGYGPADDEVSTRLLNQAIDAGYTFFDTAMAYGSGHNENLIGKALASRRNEYILATKCALFDGKIDLGLASIFPPNNAHFVARIYSLRREASALPIRFSL